MWFDFKAWIRIAICIRMESEGRIQIRIETNVGPKQ
jgi:hypothetical protein